MNGTILRWVLAALAAAPLVANAAAGPARAALEGVETVVVRGEVALELEVGGSPDLAVAPSSCAEAIEWTLEHGTLTLEPGAGAPAPSCPPRSVSIELSLPRLSALAVYGPADVSASELRTAVLHIETDGSGDVDLAGIECEQLELLANGSGDVILRGSAERQRFDLRGEGDVDAKSLRGETAELRLSGSGDISVNVSTKLTVRSSGTGDILYAGAPAVDSTQLSSGSLRRID